MDLIRNDDRLGSPGIRANTRRLQRAGPYGLHSVQLEIKILQIWDHPLRFFLCLSVSLSVSLSQALFLFLCLSSSLSLSLSLRCALTLSYSLSLSLSHSKFPCISQDWERVCAAAGLKGTVERVPVAPRSLVRVRSRVRVLP